MQLSVIGQQQQAGGILVQTAHRVDALGDIDEIDDDGLALLLTGSDVSFGFIQGDVDQFFLQPQRFPVNLHTVDNRIDLCPELSNSAAVDLDLALGDVGLSLAPLTKTGHGEKFL